MFFKKALQKSRGTRTLVPFHVNQQVFVFISRMGFRNITLSFSSECVYVFLTLPDFIRTLPVKMRIRNKENATKNCGGTRSLVPFQVDNWVFYCNLENEHQDYQFVFYTKCIYVFLTFPGYIRILPVTLRIHNQENTKQIVGAPEFWCPGTRTLVPFQVDNWYFIVDSRTVIRNINLYFLPSVFMCSWRFLVLSEYCQHNWGYTTKKTLKELWGLQSPGARAPELWCPFKLKTGFLF